ncbi:MAG: hypothetical protein ACFFG0_07840 [Candidatus Thorarchaeota archaeon]
MSKKNKENNKEKCPYCEREFVDLERHLENCKKKPDDEEDEEELDIELDDEEDELDEQDLKESDDIKDAIDKVKDTEKKVCSFQIKSGKLKKMLEKLTCKGYDATSSSQQDVIEDCILRFDNNKIFGIVTASKNTIVCQIKLEVQKLVNPIEIPIEIRTFLKWLEGFSNETDIEIIYEAPIIAIKDLKTEKKKIKMKTKAVYITKNKDMITYDLIQKLSIGKEDLLNIVIDNGYSIYTIDENDRVDLFFGKHLENSFIIPSSQFKKIIDDGERIGHREYPFKFTPSELSISIKSAESSNSDCITRTIEPDVYNVKDSFETIFANRLTNAIMNLDGDVKCYISENTELCIISDDNKDDLEICYLVTTVPKEE